MAMFLSRLAVSREHSCPQAVESGHVPKQAEKILFLSSQKMRMSLCWQKWSCPKEPGDAHVPKQAEEAEGVPVPKEQKDAHVPEKAGSQQRGLLSPG